MRDISGLEYEAKIFIIVGELEGARIFAPWKAPDGDLSTLKFSNGMVLSRLADRYVVENVPQEIMTKMIQTMPIEMREDVTTRATTLEIRSSDALLLFGSILNLR